MTLALPLQAAPRKPTHVACVGDSITAGSGASSTQKNYPSQLQLLLGDSVEVRNFGNSGSTMLSEGFGDKPYTEQSVYSAATTFVSNAGATAAVSVVIILGANDSKPYNWDPATGKNDQQYLKDYRALVDHFAGLSTKPVVYVAYPLATGTNPCCNIRGNVIREEQIPLIKQLAMEKHLPIIDLNAPTTGHPEYFGDGVHPNDAGYLVLANLVKQGLEREPTVSITSPTMGAMLGQGLLPLIADAAGDTVDISSVEFFEGATSLGKATTKPFTLPWLATVGEHQITAKATDTTLASATSSAVSFTVTESASGGSAGVGGGAGGGAPGGGETSSGGVTSGSGGGLVTAGESGMPATAGGAGVASSGTPGTDISAPTAEDAGGGCTLPGSRSGGAEAALMVASLLALAGLRRHVH